MYPETWLSTVSRKVDSFWYFILNFSFFNPYLLIMVLLIASATAEYHPFVRVQRYCFAHWLRRGQGANFGNGIGYLSVHLQYFSICNRSHTYKKILIFKLTILIDSNWFLRKISNWTNIKLMLAHYCMFVFVFCVISSSFWWRLWAAHCGSTFGRGGHSGGCKTSGWRRRGWWRGSR